MEISHESIRKKLAYVLCVGKDVQPFIRDPDMVGPSAILVLFLMCLMLKSRDFIVYFYSNLFFGTIIMNVIMNLVTENHKTISLYQFTSMVVYCLFPVTLFSYFSVIFKLKEMLIGIILSVMIVLYSSKKAENLIVTFLNMKSQNLLVIYPLILYYSFYLILII